MLFIRSFTYIILALSIFGATNVAWAETSIAIVDVQALMTESKAAKSIQEQSQAKRESFLEDLSKQEQGLRKNEKELIALKSTLSSEEFAKKRQDFEKKFVETRSMAQKQKKALDQATLVGVSKLRDKLYEIVGAIAEEKKYVLVISKQNVVIGAKSMDITAEAMERLNKSLSEVKLEFSSN